MNAVSEVECEESNIENHDEIRDIVVDGLVMAGSDPPAIVLISGICSGDELGRIVISTCV